MTEEEFAELETTNPLLQIERVALVRAPGGQSAIAIARKMPDGTVNDAGDPITFRSVTYLLDPGACDSMMRALDDPQKERDRLAEMRRVFEHLGPMPPQGSA